jgi:hypothetical protein
MCFIDRWAIASKHMSIPIRPKAYLVREEPPVKAHFGVVPEALEDGAVAGDVDVGRVVDLLDRQSLSRLQVQKTHRRQLQNRHF